MCKTLYMAAVFLLSATAGATTYTVNSTSDANTGSGTSGTLRYCISQANASTSTPHTINFGISGTGPFTITLLSNLPAITRQTTINGYSQSGASQGTISGRTIMIVIASSNNSSVGYPLSVQASNCEISGIAFQVGYQNASMISTSAVTSVINNVWIWGCYFNTDAGGTTTVGEGYSFGVYGNTNQSSNTKSNLNGWIIGTNSDGSNDNNEGNLFSQPPASSTVGNAEPIRLFMCDDFIIAGNTFGLQRDGTTPLQTFTTSGVLLNYGIALTNCTGTRIGTNGDGVNDAGERNVFAGMRSAAIIIFGNLSGGTFFNDGNTSYDNNRETGNNLVAGNYFGTDITGTATGVDLRNRSAITINGSSYNTIGSASNTAMKNIIVNNASSVIQLIGNKFYSGNAAPSLYNIIAGNYIGVLADGSSASANTGSGILISGSASLSSGEISAANNIISNNIIANNSDAGIRIQPQSAGSRIYDNTISQNSIYANTRLGINLGSSPSDLAVTPNDGILNSVSSSGTNANKLPDYGIITSASLSGNNLSISGYIGNNSAGTTAFGSNAAVEFFIADNSPANQNGEKISGDGLSVPHGEGRTYLGTLTANSNGLFSGIINVTGKSFTAGTSYITNTVTEYSTNGSTSEFGVNVTPLVISGRVYDDTNGLADNIINGTGTDAGGLNAVLYDNTTGIVTDVTAVNLNGLYSLHGAVSGSNYSVYITTASATIGQTAIPSVILPAGWVSSGEYSGAGAGNDGTPNGILPLNTINADITNAYLGIEQLPESDPKSTNISQPVQNQLITLNGGSNPPFFTGSDPEDQSSSGTLAAKTVAITSLPVSDELWYNSVQILLGADGINPPSTGNPFNIVNFNPSLMQIKLTGTGHVSTSFTYAYVDRAGIMDPTPALYSLSWPTPLPVHMVSFTVARENRSVVLNWQTAWEQNNLGFEVQHSIDKKSWQNTGFVASATINSDKPSFYSYHHQNPVIGMNYYRLRQHDLNGNIILSDTREIDFGNLSRQVIIYPNPAGSVLRVRIPEGAVAESVALSDYMGRIVYKGIPDQKGIDLSVFPSGMYTIVVLLDGGRMHSETVFKHNQ